MAFCPAHVTGFFKASAGTSHSNASQHMAQSNMGSTGAGFSLEAGVRTSVAVKEQGTLQCKEQHAGISYEIATSGYGTDDTALSSAVVRKFLDHTNNNIIAPSDAALYIAHEISVPVGYGLGCSGAVALSLSYALNDAFGSILSRAEAGGIAHAAELECKTGLGDVLASYHGGFEVRTRPGAPGVGAVEIIPTSDDMIVYVLCMAPVSTSKFIAERLEFVNGIGGKMIEKLRRTKNYEHFEEMSLEFAGHVGVITTRMQDAIRALHSRGVKCGVAMFGETVFCMARAASAKEAAIREVLAGNYSDYIIIRSKIDRRGARPLFLPPLQLQKGGLPTKTGRGQ